MKVSGSIIVNGNRYEWNGCKVSTVRKQLEKIANINNFRFQPENGFPETITITEENGKEKVYKTVKNFLRFLGIAGKNTNPEIHPVRPVASADNEKFLVLREDFQFGNMSVISVFRKKVRKTFERLTLVGRETVLQEKAPALFAEAEKMFLAGE